MSTPRQILITHVNTDHAIRWTETTHFCPSCGSRTVWTPDSVTLLVCVQCRHTFDLTLIAEVSEESELSVTLDALVGTLRGVTVTCRLSVVRHPDEWYESDREYTGMYYDAVAKVWRRVSETSHWDRNLALTECRTFAANRGYDIVFAPDFNHDE